MEGKVLRTVAHEDKITPILSSWEVSCNRLGNLSLWDGFWAVRVIPRGVIILNHPCKGPVALQLRPGLAHTEPCSDICGTCFILQITTAAGGSNMRKLIISTAAKMTSSISHGARTVFTMISSMSEVWSCKAKNTLHDFLANRHYDCRDVPSIYRQPSIGLSDSFAH